ncbi:uncharacterized protein LOC130695061 [Daphnia carinata]|uniref:uncharacterized protein LOC130695061 n=1 Tax=Daphnia carinata TaxID=120202 RepID=UPI00257B8984|nr:uncharacterized protein LOC130695061 [Daphnia carinata]
MGQKQSASTDDCEIAMMNRTDLSSHFTHLMSKSYQADECFNCGARLEDNNLFNSSGTKSLGENSVRCQQCRVCNSTNVIVEKFREVVTSLPRSVRIHHPSSSAECHLFMMPVSQNKTHYHNHHVKTQPSLETICGSPNNTTNTINQAASSCV